MEHGFVVNVKRSKKCLSISCEEHFNTEEFKKKLEIIFQLWISSTVLISSTCMQIEESSWPFIEKEFSEMAKQSLEMGHIQLIHKTKNTYFLVGIMKEVEKNKSILKSICGRVTMEKIENMELFEALQLKELLQSKYKNVQVQVHEEKSQLVLRGQKTEIMECKKYYQSLSDLKQLRSKTSEVSKYMHAFLASEKVRQAIYEFLKERGFHVFLAVNNIKESKCTITCYGMEDKSIGEALIFLFKEVLKEVEIEKRLLQDNMLRVRSENSATFEKDGNFILVYYGSFPSAAEDIEIQGTAQVKPNCMKKVVLPFAAGVAYYLKEKLNEKLSTIQEDCDVCISLDKGGCLMLSSASDIAICKAKKELFDLVKNIAHKKEVFKIRRGMNGDTVRRGIAKVENNGPCCISLSRSEAEEPQYYKCWISNLGINVVIAEGKVENSVTDVLVSFIDQNCEPLGESSVQIFQKGGWTELENAAKSQKEDNGNIVQGADSSKCNMYLSSNTATLNCKRILFVYSKELEKNMEIIWDTLCTEVKKNRWRSVCFPVGDNQVADAIVQNASKGSAKKSKNGLEIVLCVQKDKTENRTQLENICQKEFKKPLFHPITFFWEEVQRNLNESPESLQSSIDIEITVGSILDVANSEIVDVIVNSTNPSLELKKGFVSSLILVHGGQGIQNECADEYKDGIGIGDIAVSSAGKLKCMKIIHCVLFDNWMSTGNLCLKILSSVVRRCLSATEKHKFTSIAFPALGTGNLGYPFIHVAQTMLKAVNDYGKQFPNTCIKTVHIVLHDSEKECIKSFTNVLDSELHTSATKIEDVISRPDIHFLEYRFHERGLLIQLMPKETDEQVDAVIKFSNSNHSAGPVDFTWCKEAGHYTGEFEYQQSKVKILAENCFRMLESKRITSARIDIKDMYKDRNGHYEEIIEEFCKKLSVTASSKSGSNTDQNDRMRYLKKLQLLLHEEEFQRILEQRSYTESQSKLTKWFPSLLKKDAELDWKEVQRRQAPEVLCCVLGPSQKHVQNTLEHFKEEVALRIKGTGRWCVCRDYKWEFVSKKCNIKLNEADEIGSSAIEIKDEDGITYTYNIDTMERRPSENQGDIRKQKILCIEGDDENIPFHPKTAVWCVLHKDRWMFLPFQCCEELNDAAKKGKKSVKIQGDVTSDEQLYEYDLDRKKRKLIMQGSEQKSEDIISIEAPQKEGLVDQEMDKSKLMNDFPIFEFVTGVVMCQETVFDFSKEEICQKIEDAGCKIEKDRNSVLLIQGSLSQIIEANRKLSVKGKKGEHSSSDMINYVINIPMNERDYRAFLYFADQHSWFKKVANVIQYVEDALVCTLPADEGKFTEEKMKEELKYVQMMNSDIIMTKNKDINIQEIKEEIRQKKPNVFLLHREDSVEIICESYTELLEVKGLLDQKLSGKVNRRAGRKFAKTESAETAADSDVYRRRFNSEEGFHTTSKSENDTNRLTKVELKTPEGLEIKIYKESIIHLNVDCIVNAANENLWHGGGVAAAISDAAGYAFDEESKDYIRRHGPIPVGTCVETSAGKLPYKYVIHTVGPRWSDYPDKDRCLRDLCESVEVTFRKADELGMKSIALPAISSGIFGVPGDKCVEQYYKAVITFSRRYPFRSLKEIHFVDRDPSMVSAIQATFQQKTSSSCYSTTGSSEAPGSGETLPPDDKKMSSTHGSQLNKQASTADSIIKISDMLTIKVHLGNITDVTTDIVVCPQDEYCSSRGQVARGILNTIPSQSESPSCGRKKIGQILMQNIFGNSPWKMIIHAVTPRWNKDSAKDPGNFERTLNIMIQEIIKKADELKYFSIAVPLLGAGVGDYTTPVETCARNLYKAVKATHSSLINLKEIYLVVNEDAAEKAYLDMFEDEGFQIIPKICPDLSQPGSKTDWGKTIKSSDLPQEQENCCVCMDTPTNPKRLKKCGHIFCKECIEQYFEYKPVCPRCGQIYGKMKGDQPPGTMSMSKGHQRLEGFTDCNGCIIVTYTFYSGSQGSDHPTPGKWYKGISRSGYVPNNEKGRLIAKLLNVAFSRRLVFTIGRSRTTGQDGVITWNDIHHKTRPDGGPQRFGYPDSTYLDRVLEELAAKGVTPESADDPEEYKEYSNFVKYYSR
ncbi:uncharacterized protein LOC134253316 isoform X4 [Saccostrea cucullata]|uniref:uncharacterized protein LOC134253316 isoform X4 n=1 Tax=Saccostrea cuccullata TaxID=36930 RepID=UPI002ED2E83D